MRFTRRMAALLIIAFLAGGRMAFGQAVAAISPLPRQSRIILLPLPEPIRDPRLLDALAQLRSGKRSRSVPSPAPHRGNDRFSKLQKGDPKIKIVPPPLLTSLQLKIVARALFREVLAERLRTALKVALVPDEVTQGALKTLLRPGAALTSETASRLAAQLKADAVLNIADAALALPAAESKVTVMRVRLQLFGPRPLPETVAENADFILPERDFMACSAAERPAAPFGKRPSRIGAQGTGRAARQAALRAAHTLRTGEILPLCLPDVTFALAPVPAPPAADRLLFAAAGRTVRPAAVRGLPADVSGLFTPDLAPLPESSVLPVYKMRNVLTKRGYSAASLWKGEEEPNIARARDAAREVHADYVLMAIVSDLDVDAGLEPEVETMTWLAEGRAEAVGILLRVSDGVVLWSDRASVSLSSRADRSRSFSTLRQEQSVARDAAKFALLELQRRFHRYVARFEN